MTTSLGQDINKRLIAESFGAAASQYDQAAHFQRWTGDALLERLTPAYREVVLDLGTGTGYFLPALARVYAPALLVAADLSEGMVSHVRKHSDVTAALAVADADLLPFRAQSIDCVFSSLALQWCFDLDHLFREIFRVLKPGGQLVFSTLLDGTLHELKSAWSRVDERQHVNAFFSHLAYTKAITGVGFEVRSFEQVEHVLWYDSVLDLSRELKAIGAHNLNKDRNKAMTGRAALRALISAYEGYRDPLRGVPATYQVGFGVLQKPGV